MLESLVSKHLAKSILLEESGNPLVTRMVVLFGLSVAVIFLGWAALAKVDEVAIAMGKIVPQGHVQQVQHMTGGTIAELLVKDGDRVTKDQVLVRLDTFAPRSELAEAQTRRHALQAQRERLKAFLEGREVSTPSGDALADNEAMIFVEALASRERDKAIQEDQIRQRQAELNEQNQREKTFLKQRAAVLEEKNMRDDLYRKGLGSKISALSLHRQLADVEGELSQIPARRARISAQIDEARRQLAKLDGNVREKAIADLAKGDEELLKIAEQIRRLEDKIRLADLRAPSDGIVHGLTAHTVGGVVSPTDTVLEVVPQERRLLAEVKIQPKDIGHVHAGQDVTLRFIAYDFARFGGTTGKLLDISPTAFEEANNQTFYKGLVSVDQPYIGGSTKRAVLAGMNVQADIRSGSKTVLAYLFKPIQSSAHDALRER
ncbi:HlyD family type I secretion periplasmic adaptor subunit [Magnetospirillum sp. SS-4]|uniref:HlyD family type I secretion periplasmic adaptor subunit n=1 Tax=Magnetospirillum sp. SS-4 TaxID=2681465 RepID=UPI001385677E|nr:HlyD family type I secretion periplasmic adaptor subunit [Magnetospirillum sp. SS-4]CAA7622681.1 putative Type I secretion membrane fusion protein, HlyD family [Magnetospirillum sp. SS-4]